MPLRGKYKEWQYADLESAMRRVRYGELTTKAAADEYGIPRTTLHDKLLGLTPMYTRAGPPTVLSGEEEQLIVSWLIDSSRRGFGKTRDQVSDVRILSSPFKVYMLFNN